MRRSSTSWREAEIRSPFSPRMVQDIIESNLTQRTTSSQEIRELRREINLWTAQRKAIQNQSKRRWRIKWNVWFSASSSVWGKELCRGCGGLRGRLRCRARWRNSEGKTKEKYPTVSTTRVRRCCANSIRLTRKESGSANENRVPLLSIADEHLRLTHSVSRVLTGD